MSNQNLLDIKSMLKNELEEKIQKLGFLKYRADQIYEWVMQKDASSFDDMTNIPKKERSILSQNFCINNLKTENVLNSKDANDETKKYLFKLSDGEFVESVLMKYKYGYSVCVSTQVGCKMGCKFCATGLGGFVRNLSAGEILSQIQKINKESKIRISHVVLMGMGEPLENYDNVIKFLRIASSKYSLNISARNISLSTCGIADKISLLATENFGVTLSVSLHASNNKIRDKIMPINRRFNIESLLKSCRYYISKTKRRISFQYTLVNGLNDSPECAIELSHKLKGMLCHVNLIKLNEVNKTSKFKSSVDSSIYRFRDTLIKMGIPATIRRSLGKSINAACGQLRNRKICLEKV